MLQVRQALNEPSPAMRLLHCGQETFGCGTIRQTNQWTFQKETAREMLQFLPDFSPDILCTLLALMLVVKHDFRTSLPVGSAHKISPAQTRGSCAVHDQRLRLVPERVTTL